VTVALKKMSESSSHSSSDGGATKVHSNNADCEAKLLLENGNGPCSSSKQYNQLMRTRTTAAIRAREF